MNILPKPDSDLFCAHLEWVIATCNQWWQLEKLRVLDKARLIRAIHSGCQYFE